MRVNPPGADQPFGVARFGRSLGTLWLTLSWAQWAERPLRVLLLIASIALGVATLVGTQALGRGLAASRSNPLYQGYDLLIVNGRTGVPMALAREIRAQQPAGIQNAMGLVIGNAICEREDRPSNIPILGIESLPVDSTGLASGVRWEPFFEARRWLGLWRASPCLIGPELAASFPGGKPPPFLTLKSGGQTVLLAPLGVLKFPGERSILGGHLFLGAQDASRLIYPERRDTATLIAVASVRDLNESARQLSTLVGERAEVRTVAEEERMVGEVTAAMELGFSLGGIGALVIGLFLVYNGLSVAVEERRHEIGVLRAMGATRAQVAGMFLGEAALNGFCGSLLGIPLGWLLARLVEGPMGEALAEVLGRTLGSGTVSVGWPLVGLALGAGTCTAMLAGLAPALSAANEPPAATVRRGPRPATFASMGRLALVACAISGLGIVAIGFRSALPIRWGSFGGLVLFLLGGLIATPVIAFLVGKCLRPFFRWFLGIEGRMAADNLISEPARTGLVVAALAATAGLSIQTAGFILSSEYAVFSWVREKVGADLFLTSGSGFTSYIRSVSMREPILGEIRKALGDRVDTIMSARLARFDFNKQVIYCLAIDADAFDGSRRKAELDFAQSLARFPRLREPRTALMSENFARIHGVKIGETIRLAGKDGPIQIEVIGEVVDYTWNRGVIIMNRDWYKKEFADPEIDIVDLFLARGGDPEETAAVGKIIEDQFARREGIHVIDQATLLGEVGRNLRSVYNLAYAQQAILGMVALLGVVSALFVSVLQRRRELGLLRAVGADRKQIFVTVLAEGFLMGLAGAVSGILLGLALEWYALDLLMMEEAGLTFPLMVPWAMVGIVLVSSPLVATLAAIVPAWWATRLPMADALAYE